MAIKTIRIYDGVTYKDIECEEVLINNKPTGHYLKNKETQITILGTWLDVKENQDQLQEDMAEFIKQGWYSAYNCLFTDKKNNNFFLGRFINSGALGVTDVSTFYQGVVNIIQKLGYLNQAPIFHSDDNPKSIEFIITPPNNFLEDFSMFFIPLDNYSYLVQS